MVSGKPEEDKTREFREADQGDSASSEEKEDTPSDEEDDETVLLGEDSEAPIPEQGDDETVLVGDESTDASVDDETVLAGEEEPAAVRGPAEDEPGDKTRVRPARPHELLAIYGPLFGSRFLLRPDQTRIGRSTKGYNDIILARDTKASRQHAVISVRGGRYVISDKLSRNRTHVNQVELKKTDEITLRPRDEIWIGQSIFRFVEKGSSDFSPPRRAGVFTIRWRTPFLRWGSLLIIVVSSVVAFRCWNRASVIAQRPSPLVVRGGVLVPGSSSPQTSERFSDEEQGLALSPTPVVSDLNRQGGLDVVFRESGERLAALDAMERKPIWPVSSVGLARGSSPCLADVDGNGRMDIVLSTNDSKVVALHGQTGFSLWESVYLGGKVTSTPAVADLGGRSRNLVVVVCGEEEVHFGHISSGNREWNSVVVGEPTYSSPTLIDYDRDRVLEAFVGTDNANIIAYDCRTLRDELVIPIGKKLATATGVEQDMEIRAPPAAGDITGDFIPDIVVTTRQGYVVAVDGKTQDLLWYSKPGRLAYLPMKHSSPVLADFDGDGILDVVVASLDGSVRAFKGNSSATLGQILWEYDAGEGNRLICTPSLGDINKDGILDIVVGTEDGRVVLLDGNADARQRVLWESPSGDSPISASPLVADLDGDGDLDILAADNGNRLFLYTTNSRIFSKATAWGMIHGSGAHLGTSAYAPPSAGLYYRGFAASSVLFVAVAVSFLLSQVRRKRKIRT